MIESSKRMIDYYNLNIEHSRLSSGRGQLRKIRYEQILDRFLPKPPAVILDVGGGTGVYAFPLAKKGYTVHLIDPVPLHIEKARVVAKTQSESPLASITLGDARKITMEDNSADAILFFGPLYHLTEKQDRIKALREAHRTLKSNGLLFAVGISRFTSLVYGLREGFITDPEFTKSIIQELKNGQHGDPPNKYEYFTTAYYHKPEDLKNELKEARFKVKSLLSIDGPVWAASNFDLYWKNPISRKHLLSFIETIESEPSILGISSGIMAIGQKGNEV